MTTYVGGEDGLHESNLSLVREEESNRFFRSPTGCRGCVVVLQVMGGGAAKPPNRSELKIRKAFTFAKISFQLALHSRWQELRARQKISWRGFARSRAARSPEGTRPRALAPGRIVGFLRLFNPNRSSRLSCLRVWEKRFESGNIRHAMMPVWCAKNTPVPNVGGRPCRWHCTAMIGIEESYFLLLVN